MVLEETEDGFRFTDKLSTFNFQLSTLKIPATNPEKALENIRRKALQWGDTIYNPISLEIRFSQPYLIPASVIGEMKRELVEKLRVESGKLKVESGKLRVEDGKLSPESENLSTLHSSLSTLMTCHHCIRYANGMCPKTTGKPTGPLLIRNGDNIFRLEFDCKKCLMYVYAPE